VQLKYHRIKSSDSW